MFLSSCCCSVCSLQPATAACYLFQFLRSQVSATAEVHWTKVFHNKTNNCFSLVSFQINRKVDYRMFIYRRCQSGYNRAPRSLVVAINRLGLINRLSLPYWWINCFHSSAPPMKSFSNMGIITLNFYTEVKT